MRRPLAGRTFQALGEDPFLSSQMGVGLIDGIQSQGVIADANIYVANNQEGQDPTGQSGMPGSPLGARDRRPRYLIDANVDQRTLHEIYLPPFEAAVKQANVGTVMCAYNLVNGTYNCENGPLLNGILKQQWGFKGFVLSDYGAAHDTIASLQNGLDFEPWPGATYGSGAGHGRGRQRRRHPGAARRPRPPVPAHAVRVRRVRPSGVRRQRGADRQSRPMPPRPNGSSRARSRCFRTASAILPLAAAHLKSIAVIGKVANSFLTGGGSSAVTPVLVCEPASGDHRPCRPAREGHLQRRQQHRERGRARREQRRRDRRRRRLRDRGHRPPVPDARVPERIRRPGLADPGRSRPPIPRRSSCWRRAARC